MNALKPEQKDALAKAFTGFLEQFPAESVPDGMEAENSEDTPKEKKGISKYMEQM